MCVRHLCVFKPSAHFLISFFNIELHELFILEINPLSSGLFANIFTHSEHCLFILFMISFAVKKILS